MGKIILNGVVYTVDVDINNETPTFTEAQARTNIQSGENVSTLFGKIKKFFADLKTVAFTGAYADLTGQPTIPTDFVPASTGGTFNGNVTVDVQSGTTSQDGTSDFYVGNNIPSGTEKNSRGRINLYGASSFRTILRAYSSTQDRTISFPDASGTVALTDDIPTDFVPASTGGRFRGKVTVNQGDTSTTSKESALVLGSSIADGTAGASYGAIGIYGKGTKMARIFAHNITSTQRDFQLPDKSGTLALDLKMSDGDSIAISDFMTVDSGITVTSSEIIKTGNHIRVLLKCSGTATATSNGRIIVGTIKSAYRPSKTLVRATMVNRKTSGEVYDGANINISSSGSVSVLVGTANLTIGNTSYPWCTTAGLMFDYWL